MLYALKKDIYTADPHAHWSVWLQSGPDDELKQYTINAQNEFCPRATGSNILTAEELAQRAEYYVSRTWRSQVPNDMAMILRVVDLEYLQRLQRLAPRDSRFINDKYAMHPMYKTPLFRVRAIKDFAGIKAGDWGGTISHPQNLSYHDTAWLDYDSKILDATTRVEGASMIKGSTLMGDTRLTSCIVESSIINNMTATASRLIQVEVENETASLVENSTLENCIVSVRIPKESEVLERLGDTLIIERSTLVDTTLLEDLSSIKYCTLRSAEISASIINNIDLQYVQGKVKRGHIQSTEELFMATPLGRDDRTLFVYPSLSRKVAWICTGCFDGPKSTFDAHSKNDHYAYPEIRKEYQAVLRVAINRVKKYLEV